LSVKSHIIVNRLEPDTEKKKMKASIPAATQATQQLASPSVNRPGRFKTATLAIAISVLCGTMSNSANAAIEKMHVDSGSTKFLAVGRPSLLKIRGEGKGPQGDLQINDGSVTGELKMDVTSFSTGIDMRDHHMKEKYLEVEKFPTATLTIKKASIGDAGSLPKDIDFEGDLTLHGVTQPVKGKAHVEKDGPNFSFNANFPVKITDHKIDIPSYGGIKVADEVTIEVSSKATQAATAPAAVKASAPLKKEKSEKK